MDQLTLIEGFDVDDGQVRQLCQQRNSGAAPASRLSLDYGEEAQGERQSEIMEISC